MANMTATELESKYSDLRKAYKSTECELDQNYGDELAEKFGAQFDQLVSHETAMIAACIAL
jgi:hypothetical protein